MKKILVLGGDGYLGVALRKHLMAKGYQVRGLDNGSRERNVESIGSSSLTGVQRGSLLCDVTNYDELLRRVAEFEPDAIVHFAEQPSAPFSMRSAKDAGETQRNNIIGTLNVLWAIKAVNPDIHLVKLGTAGEYPDWLYNGMEIPEGNRITVEYQGKPWEIPTPRYAGSWYHFSKLHDSMNIDYACRIWGIRATDLNQGIVYGHVEGTRFDYDSYFGTVVNRFAVQAAVGYPLTVYGNGGQMRGFINIRNVLDAIELVIENPANRGEMRVFHQLTETHTVMGIARMFRAHTGCKVEEIENPRSEMPQNGFRFAARALKEFGLRPIPMSEELPKLYALACSLKENVRQEVISPKTVWR